MGQERTVQARRSLGELIAGLQTAGAGCQLVMVDGNLVMPAMPPPEAWTEVRLRTPAGMVTLRRRGSEVTLLVFGNATPELLSVRDHIASTLAASAADQ